jgi:hypothetical protein
MEKLGLPDSSLVGGMLTRLRLAGWSSLLLLWDCLVLLIAPPSLLTFLPYLGSPWRHAFIELAAVSRLLSA